MTTATSDLKQVQTLFEAELHLGHKKNRLHPRARKYIYRIDNGVSIIDLTQTLPQLNRAKEFIKKCKEENKTILVVATKKIAAPIVSELCKQYGISYIATKWLPGLLTNFETLNKNIKKLNDLKEAQKNGEWDKLAKHEAGKLKKLLTRLEKFYGGISNFVKHPDALVVIDSKKEHNAVTEANKSHIPVVAVTDTNTDPDSVQYPVVANDDSPKAVEFLVNELLRPYATK
jgi:small subunit ribosomal protein S2